MYTKKTIHVGSFNITTNIMYISDPCYKYGGFGSQQLPCLHGRYIGSVVMYSGKDIGTRVGEILAVHSAFKTVKATKLPNERLYIDSGQLGYFDASYYEQNNPGGILNIFKGPSEWYKRVSEITSTGKCTGIIDDKGFVSESGGMDGEFKYYLGTNPSGINVSFRVVFIE